MWEVREVVVQQGDNAVGKLGTPEHCKSPQVEEAEGVAAGGKVEGELGAFQGQCSDTMRTPCLRSDNVCSKIVIPDLNAAKRSP